MPNHQLLDTLPVVGVFAAFTVLALVALEAGFRIGHWWQSRTLDEKEGPTGMIVGSLLALMGFLLAITMGMASDRFDSRRELVLAEANSAGTTYLRAGYLPQPASSQIRDLLRDYVPLRITKTENLAAVEARITQSAAILSRLWTIAEDLARATPDSQVLALFIDSLNETIDLHETRVTAGIYARVPETVILLLILGSVVTLSMVGYNAGLSLRRSSLSAVMLILFLGAVITLVIDLDRSQGGFLKVNQQPLVDLLEQMGSPPPAQSPG
jgi:hypothetical protein